MASRKSKKTKNRGPKAPFSFRRNILPPVLGILVMLGIFGLLNAQWLIAQTDYHLHKSALAESTVETPVNTSSPASVTSPQIQIPNINVKAPIIFDDPTYNEARVQLALRQGVVHYGATANPGQVGNIVIVGHSSGQLWAPGNYKFVFTLLNKVQKGNIIIIDYKGTRYIYRVSGSEVVLPSNMDVLTQTPKPTLSLITCTPVGTSKKRLIVHADQISPKPETATKANLPKIPVSSPRLPASATSSFWHSLRNLF